ncbi:chromophore lyase CpcT/CpeT [Aeromonas enteropelogenes]|uniref:chromophore lyase CpcT/CpeT n=1 Tax=Aeromonas enteropelogenes TaxID=29489 RepID=UPI003BA26D83
MAKLLAAVLGLLCSCLALAGTPPGNGSPTSSMEPLLSWFSGEFSSKEQANYDSRFTSAELRLMEIWRGRQGYRWVYAEQYLTQRAVRPFRQRIYRFSPAPDGRILMAELTMPMATDFAGAWHNPALLDSLTPQQLSLRQGCEIWLARTFAGEYAGHTRVGHCATNFGGAATLVQHIWIGPNSVRLLDRAYDLKGKARWGSPGEGYVYLRRSEERGQ